MSEHRFVGRDREARAMLRRMTVRGGVVCVSGPAGVGKTRLLDEVGDRLARSEREVTRATGVAAGSSVPLAPFLHLMDPDVPAQSVSESVQRLGARLTGDGSESKVVIVDDTHLLDDASVVLVHQMARHGVVGMVLAWRSGESLAGDIAGLRSIPTAFDLELAPLSRRNSDALVESVLGEPADEAMCDRVWDLASGNPLFTRELVRHGVESGSVAIVGGRGRLVGELAVSPVVNDVIWRRIARLDASSRGALHALAVGGDLPVDVLRRIGDGASVEVLRQAGLVADRDTGLGGLTFAHDLHRQVVRSMTPPAELDSARRSLLRVLEVVPASMDLVLLRASLMVELDEVEPTVVLEAARLALRGLSAADAERLAIAAERSGAGLDAKLVRAAAVGAQGRLAEASAAFEELRTTARTPSEIAAVAFDQSSHLLMNLGDLEGAAATVFDVINELPLAASSPLRSMLGAVLFFSGRCADALELVEPLLDLDTFPLDASPAYCSACSVLGRPQQMLDLYDRICAEMRARRSRQTTSWIMPAANVTFTRLLSLMQVGRLVEGEDPYGPFAEVAYDPLAIKRYAGGMKATYEQLRGHLDLASIGYDETRAELQAGPVQVRLMNHNYVAAVEVLRGDVDAVRRELDDLDTIDPTSRAGLRWWEERPRMLLMAAEGDVDAAVARALELADEFAAEFLYRTWTLHDVVRMGCPELVVDSLAAMAARDGATWFDRTCAASAVAGASRDAEALLEVSAAFEAGGLDLEALECSAWAARFAERSSVGGRARATAARLSERCGQVRTPALIEAPPFLTPREFEVARHAAAGLTNAQIGERLGTSARTVGNQLHHVYSKLGVASRGELSEALN